MKTKIINYAPVSTKETTFGNYKGVEYMEMLSIWGDRSYSWINGEGKQNGCNNIAVLHHCIDNDPKPIITPATRPFLVFFTNTIKKIVSFLSYLVNNCSYTI